MKRLVLCAIALLLLGAWAASVSAAPIIDTFGAMMREEFVPPDQRLVNGTGSGWRAPETNQLWFYYPETGWWNEWFYDHPLDLTRWKKIDWSMLVRNVVSTPPGFAEIAINWSTPSYPSNPNTPPIPAIIPAGMEQQWIQRQVVFSGTLPIGLDPIPISGHIEIPNYNPEWVSIDIRGFNFQVGNGVLSHECVPEPATLAMLLGGGLLSLLGYLWRRCTH